MVRCFLHGRGYFPCARLDILQDEPQTTPTPIYTDNTGARAVATNPGSNHQRLRHLSLADHQIQQYVEEGRIVVNRVNGEENIADIFTKSLPKERHEKLKDMLGMRTLPPTLATLAHLRPRGSVGIPAEFHHAEEAKFGPTDLREAPG